MTVVDIQGMGDKQLEALQLEMEKERDVFLDLDKNYARLTTGDIVDAIDEILMAITNEWLRREGKQ